MHWRSRRIRAALHTLAVENVTNMEPFPNHHRDNCSSLGKPETAVTVTYQKRQQDLDWKRKHLFYHRGISLIPCSRTFSDYFRKLKFSFIHLRMIKLPLQIVVQIHKKAHLHLGCLHESPRTSKVNAVQEQKTFPRTKVIHWAALHTMMTIKRHYIPSDKRNTDPRHTENVSISSDEVTLKQERVPSLLHYQSYQWTPRISLLPLCPTNSSTSLWDLICLIKNKTGLCVLILTDSSITHLRRPALVAGPLISN